MNGLGWAGLGWLGMDGWTDGYDARILVDIFVRDTDKCAMRVISIN